MVTLVGHNLFDFAVRPGLVQMRLGSVHRVFDRLRVANVAVINFRNDHLRFQIDGDGEVKFRDFITLSSNFGNESGSYAQGNVDLHDGIGFPDFLLLPGNFGKRLQQPFLSRRLLCYWRSQSSGWLGESLEE